MGVLLVCNVLAFNSIHGKLELDDIYVRKRYAERKFIQNNLLRMMLARDIIMEMKSKTIRKLFTHSELRCDSVMN